MYGSPRSLKGAISAWDLRTPLYPVVARFSTIYLQPRAFFSPEGISCNAFLLLSLGSPV